MTATLNISRQEQAQANRILYDPLAWIHPRRFARPEGFFSPGCRHVLNDMLLANFALSVEPLDLGNDQERYLVRHWHLIPRAAYMAACLRVKPSLFRHGLWWKLDSAVRQFALLTLSPHSEDRPERITLEHLWGFAEQEVSVFASEASASMRTRLPLLFPERNDELATSLPVLARNALIMRMAIQHAERNP